MSSLSKSPENRSNELLPLELSGGEFEKIAARKAANMKGYIEVHTGHFTNLGDIVSSTTTGSHQTLQGALLRSVESPTLSTTSCMLETASNVNGALDSFENQDLFFIEGLKNLHFGHPKRSLKEIIEEALAIVSDDLDFAIEHFDNEQNDFDDSSPSKKQRVLFEATKPPPQ